MKAPELRQKETGELEKLLRENREKLRELRFNLASGKVKNVKELHGLKKDIARILLVIKEKQNA